MNKKSVRFSVPLIMGDERFIPKRDESQIKMAQYLIQEEQKTKTWYESPYTSALSQTLFGVDLSIPQNKSILPISRPILRKKVEKKHSIISSLMPDDIRSLPLPFDDYYKNIISYSKLDVLAICIGQAIYFTTIKRGDIHNLYNEKTIRTDYDVDITCVSFSPTNSKLLAFGFIDGLIYILDIKTDKIVNEIPINLGQQGITYIDWNQHLLLVARNDSLFKVNTLNNISQRIFQSDQEQRILKAEYSPKGKYIGILMENGNFYLKNSNNVDENILFSGRNIGSSNQLVGNFVRDFTWYKNNILVLSGNIITLLDLSYNRTNIINQTPIVNGFVSSVLIAKKGKYFIGAMDGSIMIWEFPSMLLIHRIDLDHTILKMLLDKTQNLLFVATQNEHLNTIKLFESI